MPKLLTHKICHLSVQAPWVYIVLNHIPSLYLILNITELHKPSQRAMDSIPTYDAYLTLENKFEKACSQLKTLNEKISLTQMRYNRAAAVNRKSFRYNLRIQLVELEGVRNMFYMYAKTKAQELDEMKQTILQSLAQTQPGEMEC